MPKDYGCQQVLLNRSLLVHPILEYLCNQAHRLTNCGIYYGRQIWFQERRYLKKFDLINELKSSLNYQSLYSQCAQQVLLAVVESFKSFYELDKKSRNGELDQKPRLPSYRKNGLAVVTYPKQALKLVGGEIRIPLGQTVKAWFGIDYFTVPAPSNIDFALIKELRILPRNREFYAEWVYEQQPVRQIKLNERWVLGIDPGVTNWLTCIENSFGGNSFIIDGRHVKSVNKWYNKQIACIKEGKPQGFWSKKLATITEKRNRQMRDAVNKAARIVINYCLKNRIGNIVFGWNKGQRQESSLGRRNNQTFVQIPTCRLKERIECLCKRHGIKFVETEESYTSKASFLNRDPLPTYGEKPDRWKPSGRRTKRGLYRSLWYGTINADCNGAANIIRKVAATSGFDLDGVGMGALTRPTRIKIWVTAKNVKGHGFSLPRSVNLESPRL
ncbi:RNA-guided endonuclease InsQ/TnpB family protein [Brasilonema sp. UFV-L1]|uniref:RNA-guided endonuclease InsQ/TnpB family protein n=1 Tax=Brasilonema sp. UFV-L1 TaxID=2234130 RepID=UPI001B7CFD37|nr:RNA-guided endonuclease TnpB family protein [Brasilonema sp. UFV-L1]